MVLYWMLVLPASVLADDNDDFQIELIKDNIYRFCAGHYRSVFMVTGEGIFITDPISRDAATWLKAELDRRFDVPVHYMAYSHNHVDHVAGGELFDNARVTVIAHEYAAEDIEWTQLPTATPEQVFKDKLVIQLGDSKVTLRYHGPNNGRGSVSMFFEPANVLHVVDWIVVGRMPYRQLPGYDVHGMIRSTREVLAKIPFTVFVGGHADTGSCDDVIRYLSYLEALYSAVVDGMLSGKSLETLQAKIRLDEFSDLRMYKEWLPMNIEGVYSELVDMSYFNLRPDIQ